MPQILKQEIKDKILDSALQSFLERGYRDTSMLEIAGKAGIAAGNIYNYFKNKEEILTTLIQPVLAEVKAIFAIGRNELTMLLKADGMDVSQRKMDAFIRVYQSNRKVFVLLFEKCGSTKFETTRADVIDSLSGAIIRAKNTFSPFPASAQQQTLIRAFAAAFVSGVISILTDKLNEDEKHSVLRQFLPFMRNKLIHSLR